MARPKGSKDSYKRVVKRRTDNEFMPRDLDGIVEKVRESGRGEPPEVLVATEGVESVQAFAASVLNDPEYRKSVRERAKSGRLLPVEARMLVEWGRSVPEKPRDGGMREAVKFMTKREIRTLARISACVIGRRSGQQRADDTAERRVTRNVNGQQLVEWLSNTACICSK